MLANLIVIGAQKCGTTSLHYYLAQHPEVFMSTPKALRFFVAEEDWSRGMSWYESQFPPQARVRGESSPRYTMYPQHRGVPERMSSLVPGAKLIYLVRDPIERIFSGYLNTYGHRHGPASLAEALGDFETSQLVQTSKYFMQLERYLRYFPSPSILVVAQEELKHARESTLRHIFRFIGVDDNFISPAFGRLKHESLRRRQKTRAGAFVQQALERVVGENDAARRLANAPNFMKSPFTAKYERPALDERLRAELTAYLKPDAERLRAHIGLKFERWSM